MQIRTMTVNDYAGLYALWTSCKGMGLNDVDDSAEGIERYLRRNPSTCFVAVEAGGDRGLHHGGPRWQTRVYLPHGSEAGTPGSGHRQGVGGCSHGGAA